VLVLNGLWAYGAFCAWAEDSALPPHAPPRPGRPSRAPRPHPFARDPGELVDDLAGLGGLAVDLARKADVDELTVLLPGTAAGPLASPELIRNPGVDGAGVEGVSAGGAGPEGAAAGNAGPEGAAAGSPRPEGAAAGSPRVEGAAVEGTGGEADRPGRVALAGWRVPVLAFGPPAALALLDLVGDPHSGGEPITVGGTVHYLSAVARFAADLVERGRVLPGLVDEGNEYLARWRPVLAGPDATRFGELARAMPAVCRATEGAGRPSVEVLAEALEALTDAAVRAALRTESAGAYRLLPPRRGRLPDRIPVAERWVEALTAPDPAVATRTPQDETEAAELAAALSDWLAAAQQPAGPLRTCFRLVEPEAAGQVDGEDAGEPADQAAGWRVDFALQATDDPSLVVSAADVWRGIAVPASAAGPLADAEETLLAGLGRAARLFPGLPAALRTATPTGVRTDAEGAYRFLKETAPLLAGAGFGVLLPPWAGRSRVGLKLTTRSPGGQRGVRAGGFGLEDLLEFRFDLAVGDQALDPAELAALARLKVPLVRLRGQWVELDERRLRAALDFLDRRGTGTMRAGEAMLTALRGVEEAGGVPVVDVDADGWLGDLLSGQAERRLAPVDTPDGFAGTLRPYQQRGLAWLAFLSELGLGAVLADDMGLGKTVQLLALLARERAATGVRPLPTLMVCPMSLVGNWQREAARFGPDLAVYVHHGGDRLTGAELREAATSADLVITTYALAARDRDALAEVRWGRVVCDEAQNIKNSVTRQARAVRSLPADGRIALTGTPVENHLGELWSIMEFANPGLLGSAAGFRERYAVPIERHGDELATAELRRLTGPFVLRRLKTDTSIISDLPDKLEMKVWCNLTAEQASLYQATVDDMLARIEDSEGMARKGLVLATMAKLKQVCNHPAHLLRDGSRLAGRSGKLSRLEEILEELLAQGDKALCFTQYAELGGLLQPYLAARLGCPVLYLHGGTPKRLRDSLVARFQDIDEPAVFLLSLKAGGTGLNLTAANHVIHVDRWWNPAVEDQATDRAFRIGQRKDVQVRKFVCVGTLEERIDAMIEEKKALAERIVGTGEAWLTELSVSQLRAVIALSPEAVSE
jgi:SNF2 family DNA or RNA helicase